MLHLKYIFMNEKKLYFQWDFTEVCCLGPNWQYVSISICNGLAPNRRRQAIIWTNDALLIDLYISVLFLFLTETYYPVYSAISIYLIYGTTSKTHFLNLWLPWPRWLKRKQDLIRQSLRRTLNLNPNTHILQTGVVLNTGLSLSYILYMV